MNSNYILPLLISASTLITMLLFFITIFVLINKNKHRRLFAEKLALQHQFEKELLTTRLEVQEQSFTIISQEIHDNICQVLGYVKNNLYMVTSEQTILPQPQDKLLDQSAELIGKSIEDLRNISHVLNPEYIRRIGLEDAVEKELNYLKSFYDIDFKLNFLGEPADIQEDKEIIIFRIVQEALSNITKHAEASLVVVTIGYDDVYMTVNIKDDGKGFDMTQNGEKGIGLINMRQRTKLINGIFEIHSTPETGTEISIKVHTQNESSTS